jgi:hypothetical protein
MWVSVIINAEGAFLQGCTANGEKLYIEVLDGFKEWYKGNVVLCMNVLLYGAKQAAHCFFKTFAKRIKNLTYKQPKSYPCLYFAWIGGEMVVFVAWVDGVMVLGPFLWLNRYNPIWKRPSCANANEPDDGDTLPNFSPM